MRHIHKKRSPGFLESWKLRYKNVYGREPDYDDLVGKRKKVLKKMLLDEQYGLCCYCCKEVNYNNSHIEHFKPQSKYKDLTLEYSNLHISCNGYNEDRGNCGHRKEDWYDEELTVSPLEDDIQQLFKYTVDGHIRPAEGNPRAEATIRKLSLDSFALQRLRKISIYNSGLFDDDYDDEYRNELIEFYNTPKNGRLKSFCDAIVYCLENY